MGCAFYLNKKKIEADQLVTAETYSKYNGHKAESQVVPIYNEFF